MSFSVVVPVYNHADYLEKGVLSALRSSRVEEVLLVDDGSSDASPAVIERLVAFDPTRVRDLGRGDSAATEGVAGTARSTSVSSLPSENRGAHARLNELVEASTGTWIAVLNSDDAFTADRFDLLHARLRSVDAEFVWGELLIMDDAGRVVGSKRGPQQPEYAFPSGFEVERFVRENDLLPILANQNVIATTSNMVFTRALYERVGGFRAFRYVHDWDFALRAAAEAPCLYLPHFMTLYRDHARNSIKTDREHIAAEVRSVFRDFETDYAEAAGREDVRAGLRGNRYLA